MEADALRRTYTGMAPQRPYASSFESCLRRHHDARASLLAYLMRVELEAACFITDAEGVAADGTGAPSQPQAFMLLK